LIKPRSILKTIGIVFAILALATGLAFSMQEFDIRSENILLVYVAAVLLINIETRSLLAGLFSAFICVGFFNFFFTDPRYTFIISDPNYFVSMIIFMVVAVVVNTLSSRLHKQMISAEISDKQSTVLNQISKNLLNAHTLEDIILYMQTSLSKHLHKETIIFMGYEKKELIIPEGFDVRSHREMIDWSLHHNCICGTKEPVYSESEYLFIPFFTKPVKGVFGVLMIHMNDALLTARERTFVDAAIATMLMACDREMTTLEKERTTIQIEKEKFKSSLLRSISHDIKSPLTSISAGSSLLLDNYSSFSDTERKDILQDINNESMYMSDFVDNLLNMTKIDANKLVIEKHREIVDDIISEVIKRIEKRLGKHTIKIETAENVMFVDADHRLLVQVLVNLIDNAIKHTKHESIINVKYYYLHNQTCFEVSDNGGGLEESKLAHLFEEFFAEKSGKSDKSRGTGLGLYICKAIVTAHGGNLIARNNDQSGATFIISLPLSEEGVLHE